MADSVQDQHWPTVTGWQFTENKYTNSQTHGSICKLNYQKVFSAEAI